VSTWRFNFLFDPQKDFFAQVVLGGEIDGGPDRVRPSLEANPASLAPQKRMLGIFSAMAYFQGALAVCC